LLAHVVLVEFLDRVPIEVQFLGHILDRARPASSPPRRRQTARCRRGSRTESPTALPSLPGISGNLPAEPRSPGTPAYRHWAGRGLDEDADRTNRIVSLRRYHRRFFSPPREANEACAVVTEDAFDELPRPKAGERVCIREAASSRFLGHPPIVPNIWGLCTCIKPL
jgi:hypothetical protein